VTHQSGEYSSQSTKVNQKHSLAFQHPSINTYAAAQ